MNIEAEGVSREQIGTWERKLKIIGHERGSVASREGKGNKGVKSIMNKDIRE